MKLGQAPFCVCVGHISCCRDSMQAGAHKVDISLFLCCSEDTFQEQCIWCNIENWGHFFPLLHDAWIRTNWISCGVLGTKVCSCNRTFLYKNRHVSWANCHCNMSSLHVPVTCPLVCADLKLIHTSQVACVLTCKSSASWWRVPCTGRQILYTLWNLEKPVVKKVVIKV